MLNTKTDIFENKNISPFVSTIVETVQAAIEKYWEQPVKLTLLAINNFVDFRSERFVSKVDFFSSKISVEHHKPVVIRLSKECINKFFELTLDGASANFQLSELTKLEVKILNSFCEFLYKRIAENLTPTADLKLSENSEKNINLLFMASIEDDTSFKFAISIPLDRVTFAPLQKKPAFTDDQFFSSSATVRIRVGRTKVALDELENLSLDDIVLLEDSNTSKLTLISGDFEKEFNVKADPSIVLDIGGDDDEIGIDNEVTMEKNLWDDIQIEVNAEFEKVKMTIGEIKQITQGQIVDLGSVFNNEISLFVENKKVAKGELIIINDRYAVKLNEIMSKKPAPQAQPAAQAQPRPAAPAQPRPAAQAQPKPAAPAQPRPAAQAQPRPAGAAPAQPRPAAPAQPKPAAQAQPRPAAPAQPKPAAQAQPRPAAPAQPRPAAAEDENFDYSDFEK